MMKKDNPISVYFTRREKNMLFRLSKHCKRPQSDHVRWLVEENYHAVFGQSDARERSDNRARS
jgi:hypothetical protein